MVLVMIIVTSWEDHVVFCCFARNYPIMEHLRVGHWG